MRGARSWARPSAIDRACTPFLVDGHEDELPFVTLIGSPSCGELIHTSTMMRIEERPISITSQ
jgi:hypothetical protein